MSEDEKIRLVIQKYQGYLRNSEVDVAQTEKGIWFFMIHDPEAECYYNFFRFETAGELERGFVEAAATELGCLIEVAVENCAFGMEEGDTNGASMKSYDRALAKLAKDIRILKEECRKVVQRLDEISGSLLGVSV